MGSCAKGTKCILWGGLNPNELDPDTGKCATCLHHEINEALNELCVENEKADDKWSKLNLVANIFEDHGVRWLNDRFYQERQRRKEADRMVRLIAAGGRR